VNSQGPSIKPDGKGSNHMSEAYSQCVWLEKADHELAQFTGDVADNKRQLTQEAKDNEGTKDQANVPYKVLALSCAIAKLVRLHSQSFVWLPPM
jgi:hypothetical protein